MFFIILIGRFISTLGLVNSLRLCCHTPRMSNKKLFFLCYAGFIRGAVAFGLVLRLDDSIPNKSVIITSSLSCVIATIMLFGGTVQIIGKWADEGEKQVAEYSAANGPSINSPLLDEDKDFGAQLERRTSIALMGSFQVKDNKQNPYEKYEHPNLVDAKELD
jgi:NhaP-type Na+/H+ or K+/H+ antiporter